jgi:Putative MetA-pathway of phenol degradation
MLHCIRIGLLLLFIVGLTVYEVEGQDREFQTDRPDFTEGSQSLERGFGQIESGVTFSFGDRNAMTSFTFPELLARVGAFDDGELRISTSGYSRATLSTGETDSTSSSIGDVELGGKWSFLRESSAPPPLAVIASLAFPTGRGADASSVIIPTVKLVWDYPLSDTLGLGGNFNFIAPFEGKRASWEGQVSVTVGTPLSNAVDVYGEYIGLFPQTLGTTDDEQYVSGGTTFMVDKSIQLDLRVGFGLTRASEDIYVGSGFSIRF